MASFEVSLKRLEELVSQLERGDLPLEEAIRIFEEGSRLAEDCRKHLETAEGKVEILLKQRDGSAKREPFPPA